MAEKFPYIATVTDCYHPLYGQRVTVEGVEKNGTRLLVRRNAFQLGRIVISKIHLRYEDEA